MDRFWAWEHEVSGVFWIEFRSGTAISQMSHHNRRLRKGHLADIHLSQAPDAGIITCRWIRPAGEERRMFDGKQWPAGFHRCDDTGVFV